MMTIKLEGDKLIKVPRSWSEIRLCDYEKWFGTEPQTKTDQVEYVAGICNIDKELLLESPAQVFDIVTDAASFLFTDYTGEPANTISIDGTEYIISFTDELTLGEWVDIEGVFESGEQSKLSEILSILCRPAGETYDSKRSESRRPLFANLTMDKAMPLLAFFLLRKERSEKISSLCSQIEEQVSRYLLLIRDSAANGAGIKSLPIWQRIKYCCLTGYLQNRLSKFSASSSTGSTKTTRRKNKNVSAKQ